MDPQSAYQAVLKEVKKKISGKSDVIELMFIALVANGHCLLEGVPGVAKTTMTKTLSDAIQAEFGRIQGTPDLTPRDIVGYTYLDENNNIQLKKGPVFTNILLVDELNRSPPRTMAALLETLEERQVTLGNATLPLYKPFIAFATQNPLNIEGTVPIPKVLADRFLMRIAVGYPTMEEEEAMLRIKESELKVETQKIIGTADIIAYQDMVNEIIMPDDVAKYITQMVNATRTDIHVIMGGSPRAEIAFMRCGKAKALIEGRKEMTIDDVKFLARPVLSHRIAVKSTGGLGVNGIIDGIVATLH
ncbi:MAG: MoxR family ATPase [Candidatus Micrarchaeales archaeon]|nr:MoxR family ATPase [Candidatus Micrarchaeales archaeon]